MLLTIPIVVTVIIAFGEWLKTLNFPKKYLPLVSMGLGILSGVTIFATGNAAESVMLGAMVGLSASGLFDISQVKTKG